jgi:hypothetical protein
MSENKSNQSQPKLSDKSQKSLRSEKSNKSGKMRKTTKGGFKAGLKTKGKPASEQEVRKFAETQDISTMGRNVFDILKESIVKIKQSLDVLGTQTVPEED